MTDLSKAERAALAARGWLNYWRERAAYGTFPAQPHDELLLKMLDDIYPENDPAQLADARKEGPAATLQEERGHLRAQLEEVARGTIEEWMRIVDLEDVAGIAFQARVGWQSEAGIFALGESRYGDEYGRFRLHVRVEDLGYLPPIGPENDPALIHGMEAEQPFCLLCEEDTHRCAACGDSVDHGNTVCVECTAPYAPDWVLRTMVDVRSGDEIRMPGQEDTRRRVVSTLHVPWHVHPAANPYAPNEKPAEWSEIRVTMSVFRDGSGAEVTYSMKPDMPVEILLTASEVQAIELLGGWPARLGMVTA